MKQLTTASHPVSNGSYLDHFLVWGPFDEKLNKYSSLIEIGGGLHAAEIKYMEIFFGDAVEHTDPNHPR
jgi:hypothetical protein